MGRSRPAYDQKLKMINLHREFAFIVMPSSSPSSFLHQLRTHFGCASVISTDCDTDLNHVAIGDRPISIDEGSRRSNCI